MDLFDLCADKLSSKFDSNGGGLFCAQCQGGGHLLAVYRPHPILAWVGARIHSCEACLMDNAYPNVWAAASNQPVNAAGTDQHIECGDLRVDDAACFNSDDIDCHSIV